MGLLDKIFGNYSEKQIKKIIPAHLALNLSFNGYTWASSDFKNNRFSDIDRLNYTFKEIDNLSRK